VSLQSANINIYAGFKFDPHDGFSKKKANGQLGVISRRAHGYRYSVLRPAFVCFIAEANLERLLGGNAIAARLLPLTSDFTNRYWVIFA